eukprot:TRINITY_DN24225_c0_g1_i1.p1 TRINITY_DN24225_c0_g1~~TRINITY_DN24225_c0_g1_i1.p1  ORF type:complete len:880 (-),score=38.86 TRINITY_DN24225_c0_g1_i1:6-2645(-)
MRFCTACLDEKWGANVAVVGNVRIQALSPTLVRVEPRGPLGFEDRTTFMVVNRDFEGIAILGQKNTSDGILIETPYYSVLLRARAMDPLKADCDKPLQATGASGGVHTSAFRDKNFEHVASRAQCCDICEHDPGCMAWVFETSTIAHQNGTCWPLASLDGTQTYQRRELGYASRAHYLRPDFAIIQQGNIVYDSSLDKRFAAHLLHWPSPLQSEAYALIDRPRFFVPPWGPTPMPPGSHVDKALLGTNGYDFRNMVDGDTYVFLLGTNMKGWLHARQEFVYLTGPTPILPDYAYGIWMTRWKGYAELEVKEEVERFEQDKLPLDVRGLDLDWRNTTGDQEHFYDHPSSKFGGNLSSGEWFEYLRRKGLRSYLSDHPYPVAGRGAGGLQTSAAEVAFRWAGVAKWMAKGSTFWWFDGNWPFSIPPPLINSTNAGDAMEGLTGYAWGSHVYYKSNEVVQQKVKDKFRQRPIALSKFAVIDWRTGLGSTGSDTSPAQHRFPVWWTGEWVDLYGSVESMVNSGVHSFMPFVHSDFGGDHKPQSAADLFRWYSHCSFGTIMRIHDAGGDNAAGRKCDGPHCGSHLPWSYGPDVEEIIRSFLQARYRLVPSLIAGGQRASQTGFPLVARCDFFWPEHVPNSASSRQYVFLEDVLVAPLNLTCWERAAPDCGKTEAGQANATSRDVWIPPGLWQDVWEGSLVQGPKLMNITARFDRMPMWHRRNGSMLIICDQSAMRIDEQNWSSLTLEIFHGEEPAVSHRSVYERGSAARTDISFSSTREYAHVDIGEPEDGAERSWVVRLHLLPGKRVTAASVRHNVSDDSQHQSFPSVKHIFPETNRKAFFPFSGKGSPPAPHAGPVAELELASSSAARKLSIQISEESSVYV